MEICLGSLTSAFHLLVINRGNYLINISHIDRVAQTTYFSFAHVRKALVFHQALASVSHDLSFFRAAHQLTLAHFIFDSTVVVRLDFREQRCIRGMLSTMPKLSALLLGLLLNSPVLGRNRQIVLSSKKPIRRNVSFQISISDFFFLGFDLVDSQHFIWSF